VEKEAMRRRANGQVTNFEKMAWHADRAERLQAEIEEMERVAIAQGGAQQYGRMERSDQTILPDSYMANVLLRDNHEYQQLVGARNGHEEQIQMYSALIQAGHRETGNIRIDGELRIRISPAVESA
jgi:hypothetical protein